MPTLMPKDVKPTEMKSIATINIGELIINWFGHARYVRCCNVNPKENRGVYRVSGFLEGSQSKWWYSHVA
jgi:hypothetical protein